MGTFFEMNYVVDSRDVDLFGQCRPSALLGILQEAATRASMALKVSGPEVLEKYNALWMVNRIWVEVDAPICWNDRLTIRTWHRGPAGMSKYRDFDLFRDGKPMGQAVTSWVLVDADSHKLIRMKELTEFVGTDGGELMKDIKLRRAPQPEAFDGRVPREMRYSDTDFNGHINNTHYADFACDALHLETYGQGKFVRAFQLDYTGECLAGETIWLDTAVRGNELFAKGEGGDGSRRFDCVLTLADL